MATTTERHLALIICPARWAANFAVEDWRHLTQRLKLDLLGAGHRVVRCLLVDVGADGARRAKR